MEPILLRPRSVWPERCFRVKAWWRDDNLTELYHAYERLESKVSLVEGAERLTRPVIDQLVSIAVHSESVYDATAAMDHLFDAFEAFDEIFDAFELAFKHGVSSHRKRILCCLGYLTKGGINRRQVLGKKHEQVAADYAHFQSFVHRMTALAKRPE
jgi:hypothetical protein